jgi:hypothetical protein
MDLDLPATSAALTGTVYDEGNAPIQARVRAELRDGAGLTSVSKKTDANGEYLLEGLVGGTAAITAYAEGHPNRKVTATLVENTVTPLDIYLYGGGTLNVFLANLSPDLSIRAVSVFRGALNISVSSSNWRDEYKNFQVFNQSVKGDSISVPGLEPGQYTVVATATLDRPRTTEEDYLTYLQVASAVVTVQSEGEQVEVTLAPTGGR